MGRIFAVLAILGGLVAFLAVYEHGAGSVLAGVTSRFAKSAPARAAEPEAPAPRRAAQDWWEQEERAPRPGIGQRVRDRVNGAMESGARRHGGQ